MQAAGRQEKQLIPHNKRSNPSHRFLEIGQNICIDMALGVLHAIHDSRIASRSRGRAMNTSRHAQRRRRVVPVCNKLLDRLEICKIALRSYSIPFGVTQHVVHSISLYCHKTTPLVHKFALLFKLGTSYSQRSFDRKQKFNAYCLIGIPSTQIFTSDHNKLAM